MAERAGRRSLPKHQNAVLTATARKPKTKSIKKRLYTDSNDESREKLSSFSLSNLSEISQTEYVRERQNSKKKFLKIGCCSERFLENGECGLL